MFLGLVRLEKLLTFMSYLFGDSSTMVKEIKPTASSLITIIESSIVIGRQLACNSSSQELSVKTDQLWSCLMPISSLAPYR